MTLLIGFIVDAMRSTGVGHVERSAPSDFANNDSSRTLHETSFLSRRLRQCRKLCRRIINVGLQPRLDSIHLYTAGLYFGHIVDLSVVYVQAHKLTLKIIVCFQF